MAVNQLKAGAALSYLMIVVNLLVGVLYTPFMLREMGQGEYGLYSLAASVIAYLTLLDLGFGNAIIRYTAKFRAEGKIAEQQEMFGMFMRLYLLVGVLALALGVALILNVEAIFGAAMSGDEVEKMRIILGLMSLNLAFTFPLSIFGSIVFAYERFIFQKLVSIVRILLNPLVMIVLLLMGYKAIALVVVTTVFNLLSLLVNWWYCRSRLDITITYGRFNWSFLREISIYSFWIFLNAIMDRIYWSTGQFVLGIYKGTMVVAVYAVAIQLQQLYMMFSNAISGVFLPKVTAMVATNGSEGAVSDLFIKTGRIQYIVLSYILTGFALFGRSFVVLWAGESYRQAYDIALILFVPLTVPLIQNLGISILQARGQMKFRSVLYVVIALLSLALSVVLARRYGGIGCAVATASALFVGQIVVMNIYYHLRVAIDIIAFWREILKMSIVPTILLSAGLCLLQGVVLDRIGLWFGAVAIFSVIYIPMFWRFSMNVYERNLISGSVIKLLRRL
ncbi:MAG: oligosaccharide flippase family protein [Rikenellaceae bacterium]